MSIGTMVIELRVFKKKKKKKKNMDKKGEAINSTFDALLLLVFTYLVL